MRTRNSKKMDSLRPIQIIVSSYQFLTLSLESRCLRVDGSVSVTYAAI